MYRLKVLLLSLLMLPAAIMFMACDSGGGSSSGGGGSVDASLVGQWEGETEEDSLTYYSYITITSTCVFTNHVLYDHGNDTYYATNNEKYWGKMHSDHSHKGKITTSGDTMTITVNQEYLSYNANWGNMATPESEEMTYEVSADGNTLTITGDEGSMTFNKVATPVPDSNLTGTWTAPDSYDFDDDGIVEADETTTVTMTLGSDGSYSRTIYRDTPNEFLQQESGSYGIYRDMKGVRYFALTQTGISSESDPDTLVSIYVFKRMDYELNLFINPDELIMNLSYASDTLTYTRGGTDPALPAPDSSGVNAWIGVEEEGFVEYDMIVTLNADNTFERVLLNQQGGTDPGDMHAGRRGQFVANSGEIITFNQYEWNSGNSYWVGLTPGDLHDSGYSIEGGVLTITSSENYVKTTNTLTPFESAPSSSLTGTWENIDGTVTTTVILSTDGSFSYTEVDGATITSTQSGTYGVVTIDSTDYFHLTITEEDGDSDVYSVMLFPYTLTTTTDPDDTFTLTTSGGVMVLTRQ